MRRGQGPGILLVQGAMGTAHTYDQLSQALSSHFTVYALDRRGRGLSPRPYEQQHTIARDVEDIDVFLEHTGSSFVYGLSSGAVITLEATRTLPRITRAAVYEPPFYRDGISLEGVRRLNAEIERGDLPAALVTSLLTSGTAPAPLRLLPRPAARTLAALVLAVDARKAPSEQRLQDLLPGIRYDFNAVAGQDGRMSTFASIEAPMLLLGGTKSPAFLRQAIRDLAETLPQATLVELEGLDHAGSWNSARGDGPERVASQLKDFFTG
nr:alpha/beta hydrolase [Kineosporia babensis]